MLLLVSLRWNRWSILDTLDSFVENKGCIVHEVMCKGTIDGTSCSLVFNIIALPSTCDTLASSHWPSYTSGPAHLKGTTIPCAFLHFCTHLVFSIFSTVLLFLKPVLSLELPVHRGWPCFVDFYAWVVQFQNSMISPTRVQNGVHWGTHSFLPLQQYRNRLSWWFCFHPMWTSVEPCVSRYK